MLLCCYYVVWTLGEPYLDDHRHFFFDNFFTSTDLMPDLESRNTYASGTVRINRRDFPADLKREKLVRGEIHTRQCGNLVATMWKDKRVESLLSTNTPPEAEIHAEQQIVRGRRKRVVPADSIGSLRIDDFFHNDDAGIAESPTTHVQKDVAQE